MPEADRDPTPIETIVITALAEEAKAVAGALGRHEIHRWRGADVPAAWIHGRAVLILPLGAMGNVSSAEAAARAIGIWNPAQIMIVGITGGARGSGSDLRLGDVLVPDQVIGYEHAKISTQETERRYEVYRPSHDLLHIAKSIPPKEWSLDIETPRPDGETGRTLSQVHFGPVFSGEKVIADGETLTGLRRTWPSSLGVEMEGLGIAMASYRGGPGFLFVKAVSDFADATKDDSWRTYAAEAAGRFALAVVARQHERAGGGPRPQAVPTGLPLSYPGRAKLAICQRLDNWEEIADYFEVPPYQRARFERGNEPRQLWEYLENRGKLFELPEALEVGRRSDLAQVLRDSAQ